LQTPTDPNSVSRAVYSDPRETVVCWGASFHCHVQHPVWSQWWCCYIQPAATYNYCGLAHSLYFALHLACGW